MDLMDYRRKIIANSPHLKSASGAVASFSDGADLPLKSLNVDIEPVQDLHGYDYPWVAGGGINKLPPMVDGTYTGNGITAVVSNGVATLSGTSTASGNALIIPLTEEYTVTQGYLHLCNSVANASFAPSLEGENISATSVAYACSPVNRIGAIPSDKIGQTWTRVRVWISNGVTVSGTFAPMVCEDNTVRQYAPYENICPISGWNGVKVTRTGKNLFSTFEEGDVTSSGITFDFSDSDVVKISGTSTATNASSQNKIIGGTNTPTPIEFRQGNTYTISLQGTVNISKANDFRLFLRSNSNANLWYGDSTNGVWTVTPESTFVVERIMFRIKANGTTVNVDAHLQIELGSTVTPYEPYNGVNVSIDLGQTVYGGTLNPLTGVLTVDRRFLVLSSSGSGTYGYNSTYGQLRITGLKAMSNTIENICSHYKSFSGSFANLPDKSFMASSSTIAIKDSNYTSLASWKSYLDAQLSANTPVQACVILQAEEVNTIQLTPHQIRTLYGNNTIFVDTGNVALEYWAHQ